jgi:hypothetical protein
MVRELLTLTCARSTAPPSHLRRIVRARDLRCARRISGRSGGEAERPRTPCYTFKETGPSAKITPTTSRKLGSATRQETPTSLKLLRSGPDFLEIGPEGRARRGSRVGTWGSVGGVGRGQEAGDVGSVGGSSADGGLSASETAGTGGIGAAGGTGTAGGRGRAVGGREMRGRGRSWVAGCESLRGWGNWRCLWDLCGGGEFVALTARRSRPVKPRRSSRSVPCSLC